MGTRSTLQIWIAQKDLRQRTSAASGLVYFKRSRGALNRGYNRTPSRPDDDDSGAYTEHAVSSRLGYASGATCYRLI